MKGNIEYKIINEKITYEYAPEYDFGDYLESDDNIKAIFFDSICEGQRTKVFGYLGIPKNHNGNLPAVVLVHGGGGTAFDDWAKLWVDKGYVALAIDTEGHVPVKGNHMDYQDHADSPYFGRPNSRFQDTVEDINHTWMHYATSSVMAAAELLKSLECVDSNKVGVCGISWGGCITMITTCYYDKFAFSIPIYIALKIKGSGCRTEESYNTECADIWESAPITSVKTPMLYIGDIYDVCTSIHALSACAEDVGGAYTSFQVGFGHGHDVGSIRKECFAFADYICKGGKEPVAFIGRPDFENKCVKFDSRGNDIQKVAIHYCEEYRSIDAKTWHEAPAVIENGYIKADKNINCATFYFEVVDENGLIFTSYSSFKK